MPEPTLFGTRLKTLRESRNWTQEDLAGRSMVPAGMISHFETGQRQTASADNLVKLANAFDVTIDYLVGRTDEPDLASDRIAVAFRGLSRASSDTVDNVLDVVKALVERDTEKKQKDGPKGTRGPKGG